MSTLMIHIGSADEKHAIILNRSGGKRMTSEAGFVRTCPVR